MARAIIVNLAVVVIFVSISCRQADELRAVAGDTVYSTTQQLVSTELGTIRRLNDGTLVIAKTLVVHIKGSGRTDYDAFIGSNGALDSHHVAPLIPGPVPVQPPAGTFPPDVPVDPTAVNALVVDTTEGEAQTLAAAPFLNLTNGFVYITGTVPATQSGHVVAGSDGTKFILEIDKSAGTEDKYIYRLYVFRSASFVKVQAVDPDDAATTRPIIPVRAGRYVEIRKTLATGKWELYGPSFYPTGADQTVQAVIAKAAASNVDTTQP